ncbi:MAG: hypothetical protein ABIQ64_00010 [Candidatus Saccharimonadales bacterium]
MNPQNPQNTPIEPQQPMPNNQPVSPESTTQTASPTPETLTQTPVQPVFASAPHSRKKLFIIIGAVVAALLLLGFAVFSLWYNKPENVVSDSFMKFATAKSSQGSATMVIPSGESSNNVAFSYAQNEANELSGTASVKSTGSGPALDIKGSFAADKAQTAYIKLENLRTTLDAVAKSDPSMALYGEMFAGVVDAVDNKWISVSQADLQKLSGTDSQDKELSCVEGKVTEFKKSSSQQNEIQKLFAKYPFIKVTQVGTETVEGVYSNHYQLKPDEAKAKDFLSGAKTLTLVKAIDDCVSEDIAKQLDEAAKEKTSNSDSKPEGTIDYWVGVWSHEPVKLSMKSTENKRTSTVEFKPKLNTNPTVTIPKADKSIIELQQETTAATSSLYGDMTEPMPLDDL